MSSWEAGPLWPLLPADATPALSGIGGPEPEPTGGAFGPLDHEGGGPLPGGPFPGAPNEPNSSPSSMPLAAVEALGSYWLFSVLIWFLF